MFTRSVVKIVASGALMLMVALALGTNEPAGWARSESLKPLTIISTWVNIEDIVPCASEPSVAWAAGVGPGPLEALRLFKITGFDRATPKVDTNSFIDFLDDNDFGTGLPVGIGPRGYPGMALDTNCAFAYLPSPFLDTVLKVDLKKGITVGNQNSLGLGGNVVLPGNGVIVWPAGFSAKDGKGSISRPADAQLIPFRDNRLIVSAGGSNQLYVLDAVTGSTMAKISTNGTSPSSVVVVGNEALTVNDGPGTLFCADLASNRGHLIPTDANPLRLGKGPFSVLSSSDGERLYVSSENSNTVSVIGGRGCLKDLTATIAVGNAPLHMAISPNGRLLFVSNATDNSVSVIDTQRLSVKTTINVAGGQPAPLGVVAVSNNNRYLFVFWEGAIKGVPGRFQLYVYDVSSLYE